MYVDINFSAINVRYICREALQTQPLLNVLLSSETSVLHFTYELLDRPVCTEIRAHSLVFRVDHGPQESQAVTHLGKLVASAA